MSYLLHNSVLSDVVGALDELAVAVTGGIAAVHDLRAVNTAAWRNTRQEPKTHDALSRAK